MARSILGGSEAYEVRDNNACSLGKRCTVNRPWVGSLGRMGRTEFEKAARKGGGREGNIRWKIRRGGRLGPLSPRKKRRRGDGALPQSQELA